MAGKAVKAVLPASPVTSFAGFTGIAASVPRNGVLGVFSIRRAPGQSCVAPVEIDQRKAA